MLRRKIGDKVFINPYSNTTGIVIDSKEITQPFNFDYDYIIKFDSFVDMGWGLQDREYYKDDELDKLLKNWNMVKGII